MKVTVFEWTRRTAEQSSPFPCDSNTITIELTSNVPLVLACQPTVTLSGFGSVEAPASAVSNLTLSDVGSSGAVGAAAGFGERATWRGDGTIEFGLVAPLQENVIYKISFDVTNPSMKQGAPSISVETEMSSQGLGLAGSKDVMSYSAVVEPVDASQEVEITAKSEDPSREDAAHRRPEWPGASSVLFC